MMEKSSKIKVNIPVLLVDDDTEFANSLKRQAADYQIFIIHKTNFKDMEECLPVNIGKIACVILDLKCLIDPDSSAPREEFLSKAIRLLDQKYPHLPRFVLTGDSAGYDHVELYSPDEKRFKKTQSDIISLFQEIHSLDVKEIRIRSRYSSVFSIFDLGIMPVETEGQLLELLSNQESEYYNDILDNLSKIRRIEESIFQTLNKKRPDILPSSSFKDNGDISFWKVHNHLKGNPTKESGHKATQEVYYSGPMDALSEMVYNVSSDHGAHTPYENPDYRPTKYTIIASVNALLDLILWFGSMIKSK